MDFATARTAGGIADKIAAFQARRVALQAEITAGATVAGGVLVVLNLNQGGTKTFQLPSFDEADSTAILQTFVDICQAKIQQLTADLTPL